MDGLTYIKRRQQIWARRNGIKLVGSQPGRGVPAYTTELDYNFCRPLSDLHIDQFRQGDGNPLGNGKRPGKLAALHSSDAIAANFFGYWSCVGDIEAIASACKLPVLGSREICFEAKFPIFDRSEGHRRPPNIDVAIHYNRSNRIKVSGIESKLTEPYGNYSHTGLHPRYLEPDLDDLWHGLDNLRKLAESISPEDKRFPRLHPAQLIKHILGMTRQCGRGRFRLLYLWYAVPCPDGEQHRRELEEFTSIVAKDDVVFQSMTWQELLLSLASKQGGKHQAYLDYLSERYL